ncbi:MAG: tRNA (adenosine(37)-N6)-threonylcarbamoyltransferase complex ATPase subunit type 1 TsaE [Brevinematia bacterium]
MSIKFVSRSVEETFDLGKKFASGEIIDISEIKVFMLKGELGSGKTSFVRGFSSFFGLEDLVSSPSFTVINEYVNKNAKIAHLDFYRIKSPEEIEEIGFYELIDNFDFVFIEWPEKIENKLKNASVLNFYYSESEGERIIEVEG